MPSKNNTCACTIVKSAYDYGTFLTVSVSAVYLGYDFNGWYDGETLLTTDTAYSFYVPANDVEITAKISVKQEMKNFLFTSTADTCTITGVDDSDIANMIIPDYVTNIGKEAFYGCKFLTEIYYNATACADLDRNNRVFYQAGESGDGIAVTIGKNVKKIPAYLFCPYYYSSPYSPKITSVVFEGGSVCESIGECAFYYCTSLTSVTIGDGVTSIGTSAFSDCTSLTSVTIGNSVTSIGTSAFYECTSLTSVTIGDGVTSIGYRAFYYCTSLTSVNYIGTIDQWVQIEFGDYYSNPLSYAKNLYINNTLVTTANITSATKINAYAFSGCTSLTSITIPDSVTSIGGYAFDNCTSLTSVTIGDGVTSIGYGAFSDCISLKTVYYMGTAEQWTKISIANDNSCLTNAARYYYSKTEPALNAAGTAYDGNYWHYIDGTPTVWLYIKES